MLATKISFINEVSNLAERLGADIEQVRIGIGSEPRIGYQFIYPRCGYGGSCFPKDVRALGATAAESGYEMGILRAVEAANDYQKTKLFSHINQYLIMILREKRLLFGDWHSNPIPTICVKLHHEPCLKRFGRQEPG